MFESLTRPGFVVEHLVHGVFLLDVLTRAADLRDTFCFDFCRLRTSCEDYGVLNKLSYGYHQTSPRKQREGSSKLL
jgi:hypothetical protein